MILIFQVKKRNSEGELPRMTRPLGGAVRFPYHLTSPRAVLSEGWEWGKIRQKMQNREVMREETLEHFTLREERGRELQ